MVLIVKEQIKNLIMELEMLYELCFNKKIVKIKTETFELDWITF